MFVGPSLKKYAKEKGMKISKDFVYGEIDGYMVTVVEGFDIKILSVSCKAYGDEKVAEILKTLDLKKKFSVSDYEIFEDGIQLTLKEIRGIIPIAAMSKIKSFLEIILPKLKENCVIGLENCAECSESINNESETKIVMRNGFVHKVHSDCVQDLSDTDAEKTEATPKPKNNLVRGTVGGLLGTTFGAFCLWNGLFWGASLLSLDGIVIIASCCALAPVFVGLFSERCYNWFGGKLCKSGVVSLCVCQPIGYVVGYPLMAFFSCIVLVIRYFIKKGLEFELQAFSEKFMVVAKVLLVEKSMYMESFFWFFVVCIATVSLLTGPYAFLRKYVNQNLESMKVSKVIE